MKKTTKKDTAANIWCGPTIPGVAKHFEVYSGGVPDTLAAAIKEHPPMAGLLVDVSEFPVARVQIEQGTGCFAALDRMVKGYYTK